MLERLRALRDRVKDWDQVTISPVEFIALADALESLFGEFYVCSRCGNMVSEDARFTHNQFHGLIDDLNQRMSRQFRSSQLSTTECEIRHG